MFRLSRLVRRAAIQHANQAHIRPTAALTHRSTKSRDRLGTLEKAPNPQGVYPIGPNMAPQLTPVPGVPALVHTC